MHQVDNRTFPCYYPGQELKIRLISQGWLHVGSLSCPSCTELCQVKYSSHKHFYTLLITGLMLLMFDFAGNIFGRQLVL